MSKLYDQLKKAERERNPSSGEAARTPALLARALRRANTERERAQAQEREAAAQEREEAEARTAARAAASGDRDRKAMPLRHRSPLAAGALKVAGLVAAVGTAAYLAVTLMPAAMTPPAPREDPRAGERAPTASGGGLFEPRLERTLDLDRKARGG